MIKAGRNRSGSQRYQCKACGRVATPAPAVNGYDALPALPPRPAGAPEQVELDELFTFVGSKKARPT